NIREIGQQLHDSFGAGRVDRQCCQVAWTYRCNTGAEALRDRGDSIGAQTRRKLHVDLRRRRGREWNDRGGLLHGDTCLRECRRRPSNRSDDCRSRTWRVVDEHQARMAGPILYRSNREIGGQPDLVVPFDWVDQQRFSCGWREADEGNRKALLRVLPSHEAETVIDEKLKSVGGPCVARECGDTGRGREGLDIDVRRLEDVSPERIWPPEEWPSDQLQ